MQSPSQIFAVPLTLLAIDLLVNIVRRRSAPRTWLLLTATLVACAGAKSSVLPVLFGGLALAALVALLAARHRLRVTLSAGVLTLAVVLLTQSRLAGGQNGSTLQPLATLKAAGPWKLVQDSSAASRGLEAGLGANGHPAYSQIYFLKIGIVAWQLLALWGYGRSLETARHGAGGKATLRAAVGGGVIGAALLLLARFAGGPAPSVPLVSGVTSSLERSLLVVIAATVLGAAALFVARRERSGASTALVVVGLASAVLSAGLYIPARRVFTSFGVSPSLALVVVGVPVATVAFLTTVRWSRRRVGTVSGVVAAVLVVECVAVAVNQSLRDSAPAVAGPVGPTLVTADEVAAARWLGQNAGQYDIIATNVHCLPTRTTTHRDARAFWVSGLSGRRVLVEGWGYTDAAQAAAGRNGLGFSRQLFDDKALFALNEGVFTDPTPEKVRKLYASGCGGSSPTGSRGRSRPVSPPWPRSRSAPGRSTG